MKLFIMTFIWGISLLAEPIIEMFSKDSEQCINHGAQAMCPKGTKLQFSDDQRCACLMDGQFSHPRKCMIGGMKCDVKLGQSYSWLHRYEIVDGHEVTIETGCACVVSKHESLL